MDKISESLSDTLDIDQIPEESALIPSEGIEVANITSDNLTPVGEDTEYARENIKALIKKGVEALNTLIPIARESQKARDYEVAAALMKTLSDLNKDLLEIQKRKSDIEDQTGRSSTKINVDKAIVFSGSTTELIKLIKKTTDDIIE
jgi:replication fork clamp-binding protein CrfC